MFGPKRKLKTTVWRVYIVCVRYARRVCSNVEKITLEKKRILEEKKSENYCFPLCGSDLQRDTREASDEKNNDNDFFFPAARTAPRA